MIEPLGDSIFFHIHGKKKISANVHVACSLSGELVN